MQNYQFVTAVHGNESLPTLALASAGISQIVANPRALSQCVRYTERDLNASFGVDSTQYEVQRARELMRIVDPQKPVVDFHTFSCKSVPFAIVVDPAMLPLAASLGVAHVVYMKHNIKAGHSLINYCPGVSIEVGTHTDPRSFTKTLSVVERLSTYGLKPGKVRVYEVYGRIEEQGTYTNFVETDGFVPVLYGERAYPGQGFYGLKAHEVKGMI